MPNSIKATLIILLLICSYAVAQDARTLATMKIDARDLPRKLLTAELNFPFQADSVENGKLALWYPKWVPGSHGPGGPIQNVAGLEFESDGQRLNWQRTPGEFYRVEVDVPAAGGNLTARIRYITNQPSTNSMGTDSFGSSLLGFVSPSTVLLYPESWDIDKAKMKLDVTLPDDWKASTALGSDSADKAKGTVSYPPCTIRDLVDSPVMCGKYRRVYDLSESADIPPHRMHIFSEAESVLTMPPEMHKRWQAMVTQAARIFGSHPFEQFDILLATTDLLSKNGLEHSRCTFNILGQRSMQDPKRLKGWDRLLIPHEYIHSWCGKYRRPAGMATSDFHSPKGMDLLWVYEGLTQYLGELTEARCGLMSPDEFRHRLEIEVRRAMHQQGRDWRTLSDTGACSPILRAGSDNWPRLRRSQDYYMEGMLLWIEADAIIRKQTGNTKSLDDFCHHFFAHKDGDPHPNPFTRRDVIDSLNSVVSYDWEGLIRRRVDMVVDRFDPSFVGLLGYAIQFSNKPANIPGNTFRASSGTDLLDSIGCMLGSDGTISDLSLGSPAFEAGLGPGMKLVGVNGHKYSKNRMLDAIASSVASGKIDVMLVSGDSYEHRTIRYEEGPKYMTLVRQDGSEDLLGEIVKPR